MDGTLYTRHPSPIGELLLVGDELALRRLELPPALHPPGRGWRTADEPFAAAREQLDAYFDGELREFELPLALDGTPFALRVWGALRAIPYGTTCSYGQIAERIGSPRAARAVGLANGRNPIAIVVPCHRVIGADGSLTGYGGGLECKARLLDLERETVARSAG
jgi:methylated-DNA-[protein]-cysteine S-methyltransferase